MRVNVAIPEAHVAAPVLDAALEAVTRLNESMLASGETIPFDRAVKNGAVKWKPEPPGAEHFDHSAMVLQRRWGDCDDLAPWHAASLRHSGEDPKARAVVKRTGPSLWHAVVQRSDGSIDDPSKRAGMGGGRVGAARGATLPLMAYDSSAVVGGAYILRPQLALRPKFGRWEARADLPWHWREHALNDTPTGADRALTVLHTAPTASQAIVGALDGLCRIAEDAEIGLDEHIDRVCALSDAVEGASFEQLEDTYGREHAEAASHVVGSFFGGLLSSAKALAPFASKAIQFVPGIGPVASSALDMAAHAIPAGSPAHAAFAAPFAQHSPRRICFPAEAASFE